ncbi:class I SAM-dependent methyltransferase [Kitasatospora xanthocidica]|uniref:Class I SAM-dependent methyltransferase n=1 Tax=Kitasatospora xanthocidica TaxID=83382 RepID=A0A372ZME3_9ACTN|nr:class I SAM-dependent methyltransferase [Kitasatospora xanthocidica]RGD56610.1 class I SAM-dependent methyltransferase [Kitasatospora xanthocidica]
MTPTDTFTPAAGRLALGLYDPIVSLTRERLWRSLLAMHAAPRPGDVIVDVGCGTGSFAVLLGRAEPQATVVGVDPDPAVLRLARRKAAAAGIEPDFRTGMGDAVDEVVGAGTADTVVSSLVLHQCPLPMKQAVLAAMHRTLRPGGKLVIADYGRQRTAAMRLAFRIVQFADGKEDTQPNADGILPRLIAEAGFEGVREVDTVATVTGSMSFYTARRAA